MKRRDANQILMGRKTDAEIAAENLIKSQRKAVPKPAKKVVKKTVKKAKK